MNTIVAQPFCGHRNNPFQPPHWRWILATQISDGQDDLKNYPDDASLASAVDFLTSKKNKGGLQADPNLREALGLFEDAACPLRWEIDARMVAGQSDTDVAAAVGCSSELI